MRPKLRFILPLVLGLISLVLIASNFVRPINSHDPPWTKADIQTCVALNAPATLIRALLLSAAKHIAPDSVAYFWLLDGGYLILILALWYMVGYELDFWRQNHGSALLHNTRFRGVKDLVLIALGGFSLLGGIEIRRLFGYPITAYANLLSIPYFVWAIVIVAFYGRDLYISLRGGWLR